MMIAPHGNTLVQRLAHPEILVDWLEYATFLRKIEIDSWAASDLELIAFGAYSPLTGFLSRANYLKVIREMHLIDGLPWTLPVTLAISDDESRSVKVGQDVTLINGKKEILAVLRIQEVYPAEKELEAAHVYRTTDFNHPGVRRLYQQGDFLIGGEVVYLAYENILKDPIDDYRLPPSETRRLFMELGWRTVVAFQTRNPIHRAHEYMQKCALEIVDGLFLHPLVGETKSDDLPAEIRIRCYEVLLRHYYPPDRTFLSIFPGSMRYAGPREAVHHAIVRKNYGATHFIVGRDHAGVGSYYGPYDAQKIFSEFDREQIGIVPLFFDTTFYCRQCGHIASRKTCIHPEDCRISLSGTQVREILKAGQPLPSEFTRPQVSEILLRAFSENTGKEVKNERNKSSTN